MGGSFKGLYDQWFPHHSYGMNPKFCTWDSLNRENLTMFGFGTSLF